LGRASGGAEHAGCVEPGDGEVSEYLDTRDLVRFVNLLGDLADFPGSAGGAEDQVQFPGAGFREGDGSFDSLDRLKDCRKCVEDSKKGIHAPSLENAIWVIEGRIL